jgi:hypothetical protein
LRGRACHGEGPWPGSAAGMTQWMCVCAGRRALLSQGSDVRGRNSAKSGQCERCHIVRTLPFIPETRPVGQ